jgi:hypothetical protein
MGTVCKFQVVIPDAGPLSRGPEPVAYFDSTVDRGNQSPSCHRRRLFGWNGPFQNCQHLGCKLARIGERCWDIRHLAGVKIANRAAASPAARHARAARPANLLVWHCCSSARFWIVALRAFRETTGSLGWLEAAPTVFTVLFEDTVAMLGLLVASTASRLVSFSMPILDGAASLIIGLILAGRRRSRPGNASLLLAKCFARRASQHPRPGAQLWSRLARSRPHTAMALALRRLNFPGLVVLIHSLG